MKGVSGEQMRDQRHMRVPAMTRSQPRPGHPDHDDLQVSPLLECVEPGRIAVSECLSHCLEQFQPRVLLPSDAFQVHLE